MSVTASFYKLSKRKNSTKQPTGTGTVFNVDLKSGTSFLSPTLLLNNSGKPDFNYFSFEGMYYFITDIVSVRQDLWEIYGKVDSLATGKSAILATTAYVMYDTVSNSEIPDSRLPMETSKSVSVETAACPFVPDGGCYILSITGAHSTTGVYKVTPSQLAALIDDVTTIKDDLFDPNNTPPTPPSPPLVSTIESEIRFAGEMLQYFVDCVEWIFYFITYPIAQLFGSGDIPQNIRECKYIPFDVGVTGSSIPIYLGTFKTQQSFGKLATETVHRTVTVNIPWQASDYRRRSPYTEVYLYLPYIGMTKLSSENLVGQSSVTVAYTLALRDGSLICTVSSGGEIIGQYSGNVGASVPIGVSNINLPKAAQAIAMGTAAALSQNLPAIGMGAINFADALTPNFSCIGGLDGVAGIGTNQNITCYTVFHDTVAAPNSQIQTIGAPTMAPKSLASLTGFCQCASAHVEADFPSPMLQEIDGYLNSGFFIE